MDGSSILPDFGDHFSAEIRLPEALEEKLLTLSGIVISQVNTDRGAADSVCVTLCPARRIRRANDNQDRTQDPAS